jgi:hypothetical protein
MLLISEFNTVANRSLVDFASRAICSSRDTGRRVAAAQEADACSQALIVEVDALIAEATRMGWLWPDAEGAPRDIETMSLEEISRKLGAERPSPHLTSVKAHLARRRELWRRLDKATRPGDATLWR